MPFPFFRLFRAFKDLERATVIGRLVPGKMIVFRRARSGISSFRYFSSISKSILPNSSETIEITGSEFPSILKKSLSLLSNIVCYFVLSCYISCFLRFTKLIIMPNFVLLFLLLQILCHYSFRELFRALVLPICL